MAKVHVEFECKCFKESDYENDVECATSDEAVAKAREMVAGMTEKFCGKHKFGVRRDGEDALITVELAEPEPAE